MTEDLDVVRKRLFYRAHHRGTKEMDFVLGTFSEAFLETFDAVKLARFETVLEFADADFLAWVTGQTPIPDTENAEMIGEIVAFARERRRS